MKKYEIAYWKTVCLAPGSIILFEGDSVYALKEDIRREARRAALNRAHEIRKFEIELYWKRAAHFWLLQAAVFTAIGLVWRIPPVDLSPIVPVALAALGAVAAWAGYLSARGSKFWQENWEFHIDMLEDEFEGRLHKTAYVGYDGTAWSVSGINERLSFCFFIFWIIIFFTLVFSVDVIARATLSNFIVQWILDHLRQYEVVYLAIIVFLPPFVACCYLYNRKSSFRGASGVPLDASVAPAGKDDCPDDVRIQDLESLIKLKKPFLVKRTPKV